MTNIGITMGCPAGIGPEIILRYFSRKDRLPTVQTLVIGDLMTLQRCQRELAIDCGPIDSWSGGEFPSGSVPVLQVGEIAQDSLRWGLPNDQTAIPMAQYIEKTVEMISCGALAAMVTAPISKLSLKASGRDYPGHTEMLAQLSGARDYAMMMAGRTLRVVLATIHCPLSAVSTLLSVDQLVALIKLTSTSLNRDFALPAPRLAVAGLNPHAGEGRMFGNEEDTIIAPAVLQAQKLGIDVSGPLPGDTVFYHAARGRFDAVVCMYHDQGLIPFKLLHFADGVNVTLGLPLVRTSVDHGTAYDIAGKGIASEESLFQAVTMAATIAHNRTGR